MSGHDPVAQSGSMAPASPTPTAFQAPPAEPFEIAGAVVAIALALAAAILGYRIIRGGRGL